MQSSLTTTDVFSRCVAAITRCVKDAHQESANETLKAEIAEIAQVVSQWRLSGEAKAQIFLRPMEEELVRRFGAQNGRRLYWDFVETFWLKSWTGSSMDSGAVAESEDASSELLISA